MLATRGRGAQFHAGARTVEHGVERVLHQVVDDLAQLRRIAHDARQAGLGAGLQQATVGGLAVQRQHL